jgi:hypothetical protein
MNPFKRLSTWRHDLRAHRKRYAYYGACTTCSHDWREHLPNEGCSECQYEIDHEAPAAPATPCTEPAPGITF